MAQVIVQGIVSRIHHNGIGFGLKESWTKRDGGEAQRFWSVFLPDGVPVTVIAGDEVKATGTLRAAVGKSNPRFVDHTVSNATVEVVTENGPRTFDPTPEPPADEYPPEPAWATASIPEDTPF